eukprot:CAMPEP_0178380582 /NCGR_PEP_ID=MMETSP0689_2-20121128/5537_1 /TAXON_ID=160604 /ORGANISM="Amphidinium massartii, Strain CS-259" /LENGTH=1239 /DNA_ID=CAMNT_0020000729 /DNA_START=148 /DNA_END=3868 /DNA_ORIENTATION=+
MVAGLLTDNGQLRQKDRIVTLHVGACLRWGKWCFGLAILVIGAHRHFGGESLATGLEPQLQQQVEQQSRHLATVDAASTSEVSAGCGEHVEFVEIPSSLDAMLSMLLTGVVLCLILEHCNMVSCSCVRLPISSVIFLAGMICEELLKFWSKNVRSDRTHLEDFLGGRLSLSQIDPHAIFYVLLPPLLYESASSMPWHVIRRVLGSAVVLAGPGVVINVLITGLVTRFLVHDAAGDLLNWSTSFMLASILSATDPVAVVAALRSLGAPKKLSALIEGESLLNDGSAFVLFSVFKDIVSKSDAEDAQDIVLTFLWKFTCLAGGGVLVGVLSGLVVLAWIRRARFLHFPVLELAIILCAVYGSFFLSEQAGGSGVLTVVTFGLMMTANINPLLSHHARHAHHLTIDEMGSDRMIFFIGGMVSMRFLRITDSCRVSFTKLAVELLALYVILHITRTLVVACFGPVLQRSGYGLNAKEGVILIYGGLRGAVGLAMGLMVEHSHKIHANVGTVVAFHTSGIVLLTILVNGSTVEPVYKKLRPYADPVARVRLVMKALKKVEEKCQFHKKYGLKEMRDHWFFHDVCFSQLYSCIPNFRTIEFDDSHRPQATGLYSVEDSLLRLEGMARKAHRNSFDSNNTSHSNVPPIMSLVEAWRRRREEISNDIHEWLPSAENVREASDIMMHVMDNGGHSLGYNPPETPIDQPRPSGLYVSRRPLSAVSVEVGAGRKKHFVQEEELDSPTSDAPPPNPTSTFTVKMKKMGAQVPWVGVVASPSGLSTSKGEEPVLGHVENSVGMSCLNGEIRYNLGGQTGSAGALLVPRVGSLVHVSVDLDDKAFWQVSFSVSTSMHGQVAVGTVPLANLSPDDLYPTVEFRVQATNPDASLPNKPMSTSSNSMSVSPNERGRRLSTRMAAENILRQMTTTNPSIQQVSDSRCAVSFEPQIPTDADDLDEIFSVFLNTVTRKYRRLNERGCVDEHALSWLLEAAGEALDCAHNEVHARHIMAFLQNSKDPNLMFLKEKLSDVDCKGRYVFEPVLVEYLSLFQHVSKVSLYDRYPLHWTFGPWIRSLGYFLTRTKVECLFAFVECHMEAINEHEILVRFPGVMHCLTSVLNACKRDLALIEEFSCRRFFFSKHYLVLKLDMSQRVRALEEARDEGWISPSDVEGLVEELHERIAIVEQYFPSRIQAGLAAGVRRRRGWCSCCRAHHGDDCEEEECAPAWVKILGEGTRKSNLKLHSSSFQEEGG